MKSTHQRTCRQNFFFTSNPYRFDSFTGSLDALFCLQRKCGKFRKTELCHGFLLLSFGTWREQKQNPTLKIETLCILLTLIVMGFREFCVGCSLRRETLAICRSSFWCMWVGGCLSISKKISVEPLFLGTFSPLFGLLVLFVSFSGLLYFVQEFEVLQYTLECISAGIYWYLVSKYQVWCFIVIKLELCGEGIGFKFWL